MDKLFVPYELALKLKEKGFDEPCFAVFFYHKEFKMCSDIWDNDNPCHYNVTNEQYYLEDKYGILVTSPLYQQVVDWFREKHSIMITIDPRLYNNQCFGHIRTKNKSYWVNDQDNPLNYYEALTKAIEEALTLI